MNWVGGDILVEKDWIAKGSDSVTCVKLVPSIVTSCFKTQLSLLSTTVILVQLIYKPVDSHSSLTIYWQLTPSIVTSSIKL
jgi:hypothetical protein